MSNDLNIDYDTDVEIDESALDIEWLEQSSLARDYIRNAVKLRKRERLLHEKVKTIRSILIDKVNRSPKKMTKKDKPNAADIEACYRRDEKYQKYKKKWIDAQEEADLAELMQKEISYGRKASLENLVVLHGQAYFAGPRVPRNIKKERQKHINQKRIDKKIASKSKFSRNKND